MRAGGEGGMRALISSRLVGLWKSNHIGVPIIASAGWIKKDPT